MTKSMRKQEYDQFSLENLKKRLLADLPAIERLVMTIREFCSQKPTPLQPLPCSSCPKSETSHKPCDRLEAYLDGAYRGKLHGETTINVNLDEVRDQDPASGQEDGDESVKKRDHGTFRNLKKVESFDAMESYKPCWHLLSHKQQEVVRMYHGEGKLKIDIARLLNKAPSTVSGLLKKAKERKENNDAKIRKQKLALLKELEAKSDEI